MGLIKWFKSLAGGEIRSSAGIDSEEFCQSIQDLAIREIAFWTCVQLIANSINKCEFKTFRGNKEVQEREYYRWNVEPNRNQNASVFRHKMIAQLLRHGECLIVEYDEQLFIADSFQKIEGVTVDTYFTDVQVGPVAFQRNFYYNNVMYLEYSTVKLRALLSTLDDSYSDMIKAGMTSYVNARGNKATYASGTLPVVGTEEYDKALQKINEKLKTFFKNPNAVFPLGDGEQLSEYGKSGAYSKENSRDVRALIDDISDYNARAMLIPPALLKGEITEKSKSIDQFLTFCINPLAKLIQDEINRRNYGYSRFVKGDYMQIDTKGIKYVDLLSVATAIDKLISSGSFSINEIRALCNEPLIDEPWANEHFITKNYEKITQTSDKGGNDEEIQE